jgi:cytosine/adenosine deaminase-related metal-dependent hydrolase
MTEARAGRAARQAARHEVPAIDEAALVTARWADRVLAAAREVGSVRWVAFFEPLPDRLRDDAPAALRATANRCRAAYGVKDSVRDVLPESVTEPFLDSVDRLIRELNRSTA